jgi:AcrR family transcriptional regulator
MARLRLSRLESSQVMRRRLILGAIDLLREHGVAGATTGRIATAAGLKQASFYAHFADRDACLEAAADEIGGQVLERLRSQQAGIDPRDLRRSIHGIFDSMFGVFVAEAELSRLFLRHRSDETSGLGRGFRRLLDRARADLVASFHLYGLTRSAGEAQAHAELLVAATLGALEAVLDERLTREIALDNITAVTFAALSSLTQGASAP